MKLKEIRKAKIIAQQLVTRCNKVLDDEAKKDSGTIAHEAEATPSKSTGALRRCSMELTRQLAVMRK